MPRPAPFASPKDHLAKTRTTVSRPSAALSAHPVRSTRVQCGSPTRGLANPPAALLPPRLASSTREFLPRTSRRPPRALRVRSTPRPYRLQKSVRDLYRSHSWSFTAVSSPQLPCTASWRLQHFAQTFLRLKQRVFGRRLGNLQHPGDLRVPESFHFVQQKNVALMPREPQERALQRHPQGRVSS